PADCSGLSDRRKSYRLTNRITAFDRHGRGMLKPRKAARLLLRECRAITHLPTPFLFYKGTALRVLRFVLSALSAAFLAACVASAQAPDSAARPAQLIVKFRAPVEPEHPAFIDDLSRDAGAPLQYVR